MKRQTAMEGVVGLVAVVSGLLLGTAIGGRIIKRNKAKILDLKTRKHLLEEELLRRNQLLSTMAAKEE